MTGGSIKGGTIKGTYPSPLGPDSDYWLQRGRIIPTTPWESIWNSVGQWLGIHNDSDLDLALPNRKSFSTCSLFSDKDLFVDGACQCVVTDGIESTLCEDITYSPTLAPTQSGSPTTSSKPSISVSSSPSTNPTESPSASPSVSPTSFPTVELPSDGTLVSNIFSSSQVTSFGCDSSESDYKSSDGTTNRLWCGRYLYPEEPSGIIVTPTKLSIAKGIRIYSSDGCKSCDPVVYVLEGRTDEQSPWIEIHRGNLPWKSFKWDSPSINRNPQYLPINSSYESGDPNLTFTAIDYPSENTAYYSYRFTFLQTRRAANVMRMGEIEIPGIVTDMLAVTESPPVDCPYGCIDRCNASYDGNTPSYYCKKVNSMQSFVLSLIDKSPNLTSLYLLLRVAPATSSVVCKKVKDTSSCQKFGR